MTSATEDGKLPVHQDPRELDIYAAQAIMGTTVEQTFDFKSTRPSKEAVRGIGGKLSTPWRAITFRNPMGLYLYLVH